MDKILIIIPTFNEVESISDIIKAVFDLNSDYHILIVDDNSLDGTPELVRKDQEKYDNLYLEVRICDRGLGKAYVHGLRWAMQRDYEYILEMDADFSHDPKDIPRLISTCRDEGIDLAVGSRYIDNNINVVNWDFKRLFLSYFASKYVNFITRIPVFDTTSGFVCYRRHIFKKIDLDQIDFTGYAFQIEMKFKVWLHAFKIKEISIIFKDRIRGKTKMSSSIIVEAIFGVIKMKLKSLMNGK